MYKKTDLIGYLEQGIHKLNVEFPKNEQSTSALFQKVVDFLNADFEEMTDNCIYRYFLASFKELICFAFETGVSKSYLRCFFKHLNSQLFVGYLGNYAKTRANDIQLVMDRFVDFFIASWQGCDNDRKRVLNNIVCSIDYWMKL